MASLTRSAVLVNSPLSRSIESAVIPLSFLRFMQLDEVSQIIANKT